MLRQEKIKSLWKPVHYLVFHTKKTVPSYCNNAISPVFIGSTSRNLGTMFRICGALGIEKSSAVLDRSIQELKLKRRYIWTWKKSIKVRGNGTTTYFPGNRNNRIRVTENNACRCITSTVVNRKREVDIKRALPDTKAKRAPVVSIWKNITVSQLSKVVERPEGIHVVSFIYFLKPCFNNLK